MCFHCGNDTWLPVLFSSEVCGKISIGINTRTGVSVQKILSLHIKAILFQYTLDESRLIFGAAFHCGIRPL